MENGSCFARLFAFLYLWLVLRAFYRDGLYVNINLVRA